jgi:hypothetical protein
MSAVMHEAKITKALLEAIKGSRDIRISLMEYINGIVSVLW